MEPWLTAWEVLVCWRNISSVIPNVSFGKCFLEQWHYECSALLHYILPLEAYPGIHTDHVWASKPWGDWQTPAITGKADRNQLTSRMHMCSRYKNHKVGGKEVSITHHSKPKWQISWIQDNAEGNELSPLQPTNGPWHPHVTSSPITDYHSHVAWLGEWAFKSSWLLISPFLGHLGNVLERNLQLFYQWLSWGVRLMENWYSSF